MHYFVEQHSWISAFVTHEAVVNLAPIRRSSVTTLARFQQTVLTVTLSGAGRLGIVPLKRLSLPLLALLGASAASASGRATRRGGWPRRTVVPDGSNAHSTVSIVGIHNLRLLPISCQLAEIQGAVNASTIAAACLARVYHHGLHMWIPNVPAWVCDVSEFVQHTLCAELCMPHAPC